jgi:hypothetical protein
MRDLTATIDAHLVAYSEPDDARRAALVKELWAPDGSLVDPPFDGTGHDAITGMGAILQQHYAGHTFRRSTAVDAHHGHARYGWDLLGPDGAVVLSGIDVADVDDDGTLRRIVGFFGPIADR